jgi:hypothetical protein
MASPAEMARRYGPETPVPDWRERLVCSRYGSHDVDSGDRGAALKNRRFESISRRMVNSRKTAIFEGAPIQL